MKTYVLKVRAKDLEHSTDMLRFDGAFVAHKRDENTYELQTLRYTPARWESFNVKPGNISVVELSVSPQQWKERGVLADGFCAGMRFAQKFLKGKDHCALVEDFS